MKTRVLLTAAAMSALALSACNQNEPAADTGMTEDATAVTDDGGMAGSATGGSTSGGAMSADQAGANTSGSATGGAMSASGESLSTANPGAASGVRGIPSVEQQKEEARATLSPGGASSGPTAPSS